VAPSVALCLPVLRLSVRHRLEPCWGVGLFEGECSMSMLHSGCLGGCCAVPGPGGVWVWLLVFSSGAVGPGGCNLVGVREAVPG